MLDDCEKEVLDVMFQLAERFKGQKDKKSFEKINQEIERLELECSSAQKRAQDIIKNGLSKLGEYLANPPVIGQQSFESQSRRSYCSQHQIDMCLIVLNS